MAKKISRQEIAENDLFGDIRSSAEETISVIDKLSAALNETADAVKKSVGGAKFDSTKAIDNFVKSTEKANKLQKQAIELDKARANAVKARKQAMAANQKQLQEQEKTVQQRVKTEEQLAKQAERKNKQAEKAARIAKDETNAYKKLVKETRDLKNKSKELGAEMMKLEKEGKKNSTQWRALAREYRTTTKAAQQGDAQLKKLDSTVGDNFRNVGNYKSALAGLGKSLLMLGGGLSAVSAVRGSFGIIMDFDQAVGDLAAISGKSVQELKPLTDQAKELGATTQFSATQITEMQIELAKLGFTAAQISASTAAVANFSAATGADIPAAAALAGSSLRAFGLDASQMERVVSTLGVATTKSALDFSFLDTAMSTIAPVAKSFGFSIEDTTALLGTLANSGFDASSAATATRNILLNLADSSGDLAQRLGHPIKNADDLSAALLELKNEGVDLAEALELTDKRSVSAFNTFIENAETIPTLKEGITDVNDELEAMAEKRLDTIAGQWTLLQSAWEGWVLSVNEGSGVGETVKNTLGFIAENLGSIMSTLIRLVSAWVQYKATLLAVKAIQWVFSGGLKTMVTSLQDGVRGVMQMTQKTKEAGTAMTGLGRAMNAVPILAMVGLVYQLVNSMIDLANATAAARYEKEALEKADQQATKTGTTLITKYTEEYEESQRKIDQIKRKNILAGMSEADAEEDRLNRLKATQEEIIDNLRGEQRGRSDALVDIQALTAAQAKYSELIAKGSVSAGTPLAAGIKSGKEFNFELRDVLDNYNKINKTGLTIGSDPAQISAVLRAEQQRIVKEIDIINKKEQEFKTFLEESELASEEEKKKADEAAKAASKYKKQSGKIKKELKEIVVNYQDLIKLEKELFDIASDRLELMEEMEKISRGRLVTATEKEIEDEFRKQKTMVENTGEMETDLLDDLVRKKSEIKANNLRKDAEFERQMLQRKFYNERIQLEEKLEEERKSQQESAKKIYDDNLKTFSGNKAKTKEAEAKYREALQEIERRHLEEMQQLAQTNVEAQENMFLELQIIDEELKDDLVQNQKDMNDEINQLNDELIADQKSYYATQFKLSQDAKKKQLDLESKMWQDRMDIAQVATDVLIRLTDRRIEKLQEEIDAAQKQSDYLRELAANGNIDAQDSLAEQQRIIDEANRKKIQAEKQKQKIEFANTVFQTYGSKVQSGSETPLSDTIRDVSLLQQFIATFTPFLEGTEDTGTHGQGVDGKGGFHAILHPNERVMTKEQNKMVGDLTNEQLARVAQDYNNGTLMSGSGAMQIGSGWDSHLVLKELQSLKQVIKDKPEHNLEVENVVLGAMEIVHTKKAGRNTYHNRYRVKK